MAYSEIVEALAESFRMGITKTCFLPAETLQKARHIYLIGSGTSRAATIAAEACYLHYLDKLGTYLYVETPVANARYTKYLAQEDPTQTEQTLLVAVCCGEYSPCTLEALARAKNLGIPAVAITDLPDEKLREAAPYLLQVSLPEKFRGQSGCCAYLCALVALSLLAAHIGELRGDFPGAVRALTDAMVEMGDAYEAIKKDFERQALGVAQKWKTGICGFYGVGDGADEASAKIFSSRGKEAAGLFGGFTNSVDWRHNIKYIGDAKGTCVVFFGEKNSGSRNSIATAVDEAYDLGFRVVFVSDVSAAEFGVQNPVESFLVPKAPDGFAYLSAYFNYLPADVLAACFAIS